MNNIIYQEKQRTYLMVVGVFILIALGLLALLFFPDFFKVQPTSSLGRMLLFAVIMFDLLLFWSFARLAIKVTDNYLEIRFGIFKKKIFFKDIKGCVIEEYQKSRYFGYGIRLGRDKSIGYIARDGRGIRLNLQPRDYFFTTERPEQLLNILKSRINH